MSSQENRSKPPPSAVQRFATGLLKFFVLIIVFACIKAGCEQIGTSLALKKSNDFFDKNPMAQAWKQTEPETYEDFRKKMQNRIEMPATARPMDGLTNEEYAARFFREFMDRRLSHATPATLKEYMRVRIDMYERLYKVSPDVLFDSILQKTPYHERSEEFNAAFRQHQDEFYKDVAVLVTAPQSDTPLVPDDNLAIERIRAIDAKLIDEELKVLDQDQNPDVDRALYCRAAIHLLKEATHLPEVETVQVCRYLKILPNDDRVAN